MLKRIFTTIFACNLILVVCLGFINYLRIRDSVKKAYEERLAAAEVIAGNIDNLLQNNLARLYDISLSGKIDFKDRNDAPEREALKVAYQYSVFSDGVFLLDKQGSIVQIYPYQASGMVNLMNVPAVSRAIHEMKPMVSNVFTLAPVKKRVLFVVVPLKGRFGEIVGAAGGIINPASLRIAQLITTSPREKDIEIELIDEHGVVIAANHAGIAEPPLEHRALYINSIAGRKSFIGTCHRCHEGQPKPDGKTNDIIALAPLSNAAWVVARKEPEKSVLVSTAQLEKDFIILVFVALATAFLLALGMSRRIVKPVQELIRATERIGRGDLSEPVAIRSKDEIGTLAKSFDDTRAKLAMSLKSIQQYSEDLEQRVYDRTKLIEEKQLAIQTLLKKVITTQEDERKRIARELHDESLQALSAVLMEIGVCKIRPDMISPKKISELYDHITKIINETNNLIQNLRPTVLDDLGFEASIVWILDRNLKTRGIKCHLNMKELSDRYLAPDFQITLFRLVQEATTNIARHSNAHQVFVFMKDDGKYFTMSIEDDGDGFDTKTVLNDTTSGRGLGILGMKERAALLKGQLTVCSSPGTGTSVFLKVPLNEA
ncbi:MAG TPA: HAMP domain-containing protein [Nitrospirota bacterium]|nr:HAMP domain-containing protein [Nitrospirota bacterium]